MNMPKKIIIVLVCILILCIAALLYQVIVVSPQNTEGGYLLMLCIGGMLLVLTGILFSLFTINKYVEYNFKSLESLNKLYGQTDKLMSKDHDDVENTFKNIRNDIKEVQDRNSDNFYVIDHNLGRLIIALRNNLPIDKEFETNYLLSIARYKIKSKSNTDKEQGIFTMHALGGESETDDLIDIIDNHDIDDKIRELAKSALKDIFNQLKTEHST